MDPQNPLDPQKRKEAIRNKMREITDVVNSFSEGNFGRVEPKFLQPNHQPAPSVNHATSSSIVGAMIDRSVYMPDASMEGFDFDPNAPRSTPLALDPFGDAKTDDFDLDPKAGNKFKAELQAKSSAFNAALEVDGYEETPEFQKANKELIEFAKQNSHTLNTETGEKRGTSVWTGNEFTEPTIVNYETGSEEFESDVMAEAGNTARASAKKDFQANIADAKIPLADPKATPVPKSDVAQQKSPTAFSQIASATTIDQQAEAQKPGGKDGNKPNADEMARRRAAGRQKKQESVERRQELAQKSNQAAAQGTPFAALQDIQSSRNGPGMQGQKDARQGAQGVEQTADAIGQFGDAVTSMIESMAQRMRQNEIRLRNLEQLLSNFS